MGEREAGEAELIRTLLVANRGEIAVRIARTAREMGVEPVAVYSDSDAGAFHVGQMPRAVALGAGPPRDTYLSIPRLLEAAREAGADAIHPGYGFLSENAEFARAVEAAGLTWVGPPASAIEAMGDKLRSRARMREAGVPVVPGSDPSAVSAEALASEAKRLGFPVLVKASAGGGGKGMSRVDRAEDLPAAIAEARRLAASSFGDEIVYLEKLLDRPHHIEFQIFGDKAGHVMHLFERECSVQRRHQKIIEETPSPALDAALRSRMAEAAVEAGRAVGYVGAGTVELLLDEKRNFYFLEMNTRLQVEHAITEATLGIDLVRAQLEIAAGGRLPDGWARLHPRGHAIELRLYAEDPVTFLPRSGEVLEYDEPSGPGVRVDSGIARGSRVGLDFDPLLAKLIVFGPDRGATIVRAQRALEDWVVLGVETNRPLLSAILACEEFAAGRYTTDVVSRLPERPAVAPPAAAWIAAARMFGRSPAAPGAGGVSGGPPSPADPWSEASGWRMGA
jgi:acetyl/propionyl-CoA carboxylase alpha subunit